MNNRVLIRSIALLAFTALAIALFMLYQIRNPRQNPGKFLDMNTVENPYSEFGIPPFNLTDQHGEPIDHTVLDNEFTVVDFFFTSCPLYCPTMTAEMARVQEASKGTDLKLLSISIDGEFDTPEEIDMYATAFKADPDRWRFATGDPDVVAKIVLEGLKFHMRGRAETQAAGGVQIEHPTKLILLGPDRSVIGLYTYNNPEEIDELIETALELVK
jgi:protein SCO1/2